MRGTAAGIIGGIVVALVAPGAASAAQPACGEVLTKNTELTADLACPGDALTIGKAGITLDLNGHTISSSGEGTAGTAITDNGFDRVVVENGSVGGSFATVFSFRDVSRSRLEDVEVGGRSTNYLAWNGGAGNTIAGNRFVGALGGLSLVGFDRGRIADNFIVANFGALSLSGSKRNLLVDNELIGDGPTNLYAGSDRNVLVRNKATQTVASNSVTDSSRNAFYDNQLRSVRVRGASDRNVYVGNSVSGASGSQAAVDIQGGIRTALFGNTLTFGGYGIRVQAATSETKVVRNTTNGFGFDGINVQAPGTLIRDNTANDNRLYGINAVSGVIDGGGNHASGDGNPEQCVGVVCEP